MTETEYFVPLSSVLPCWPYDKLAPSRVPATPLLHTIGLVDYEIEEYGDHVIGSGTAAIQGELELEVPGIDALTLVIGDAAAGITTFPIEIRLEAPPAEGDSQVERVLRGLVPTAIRFPDIGIKLRFSRDCLRPMQPRDPDDLTQGFDPLSDTEYSEILFRAALDIDFLEGVTLHTPAGVSLNHPSMIGTSGLILDVKDLVIDLSDSTDPPGIDPVAWDLPPDWQGVFLRELDVYGLEAIAGFLPDKVSLTNWRIGLGGVAGRLEIIDEPDPTVVSMADRSFALRKAAFAFQQNALTEGLIQFAAKLDLQEPKVLYLDLRLTYDPAVDFPESIGWMASVSDCQPAGTLAPDGLITLPLWALNLTARRLGVRYGPDRTREGYPDDQEFLDLIIDGTVTFLPEVLAQANTGAITVTGLELQVYPDFAFRTVRGGWFDLPEVLDFDLGEFPLSVSRIGLGAEGDEFWVGLDAQVKLADWLPAGRSVEGLRVWHNKVTDTTRVTFTGIGVEFKLEDTLYFKGAVSLVSGRDKYGIGDDTDYTFGGEVTLDILPLNLQLDAELLLGVRGGKAFYYIVADADLPVGIPLFSTGASLYGFAGICGYNIVPNRSLVAGVAPDDWRYYDHWYAVEPRWTVTAGQKWLHTPEPESALVVAAGTALGSSADNGYTINAKGLFALLTPGPAILLEGRADILKDRAKLDQGEPAFRALFVLDFQVGQFLLNVQADYKLAREGSAAGALLDTRAEAEAFFSFHNASDWHLYMGRYQPTSRRIRATTLKLIGTDAYFMIDGGSLDVPADRPGLHTTTDDLQLRGLSIALGARAAIHEGWCFGPASVALEAWIAGDGPVSFDPIFFYARVELHGRVALRVFGSGFGLSTDAWIAAMGPEPFNMHTKVGVEIDLPWPLPDISFDVELSWGEGEGFPPPTEPFLIEASVASRALAAGYRPLLTDGRPVAAPPLLPLDGNILLVFRRPMLNQWDKGYHAVTPYEPEQVGDHYYRYLLRSVTVRAQLPDQPEGDPQEWVFGHWVHHGGDSRGVTMNRLMLFGRDPYPYLTHVGWPEDRAGWSYVDWFHSYYQKYPCGPDGKPWRICLTFDPWPIRDYPTPWLIERRGAPDVTLTALPEYGLEVPEDVAAFLPMGVEAHTASGVEAHHALRLPNLAILDPLAFRNLKLEAPTYAAAFGGLRVELGPAVEVTLWIETSPQFMQGQVTAYVGPRPLDAQSLPLDQALHVIDFSTTPEQPISHVIIQVWQVVGARQVGLTPHQQTNPPSDLPRPYLGRHGGVKAWLLQVCARTPADVRAQTEIARQRTRLGRIAEAFEWEMDSAIQPSGHPAPEQTPPLGTEWLHTPNTRYRISVDVAYQVSDSKDVDWTTIDEHPVGPYEFTVDTAGAPADLTPYIAGTVPADGAIPVYYDYDLQVKARWPYVEAMYQLVGDPIHPEVVDALGNPVSGTWRAEREAEADLPRPEAIYVDTLVRADCVTIERSKIPGNDRWRFEAEFLPETLYEVRLRGGHHPAPLYAFRFTTSRYPNFAAHVGDFPDRVWNLFMSQPLDRGVSDPDGLGLQTTPNGPDRALSAVVWDAAAGFADRVEEDERLNTIWYNILGLAHKPRPARHPEIHLLWGRRTEGGAWQPVGVVVDSPEPLFHAGRTEHQLQRWQRGPFGIFHRWVDVAARVVRNLDGTRALFLPRSLMGRWTTLGAAPHRIHFTYRCSGVAGLPDLTRKGDARDEIGFVVFDVPSAPANG